MKFFGRKKQTDKPSGTGNRSREFSRGGQFDGYVQPTTFSYYASRRNQDEANRTTEAARRLGQPNSQNIASSSGSQNGQSFLRTVSTWLMVLFALGMFAKIISLSPESRVIVVKNGAENLAQIETPVYQKKANELIASSLLNRTKFTLDTKGVATAMQTHFPELQSVVVTVPLIGERPIVYVMPVKALVSIETNQGMYSLSDSGRVITRVASNNQGGVIIRDLSGVSPEVGKQLIPATTVSFIQRTIYQFEKAGLQAESITLPNASAYEVDLKLKSRASIVKMNLTEDPLRQSGAAIASIKQLGLSQPTYVDVRVPGRVYYK